MDTLKPYADLQQDAHRLRTTPILDLFAADARRAQNFCIDATDTGIYFDYSKNKLDARARDSLFTLARAAQLPEAIHAMYRGEAINFTEGRAALHVLLRGGADQTPENLARTAAVADLHQTMQRWSQQIRNQQWLGFDARPITTVVNIGIGGSDLGPRMATHALGGSDGPAIHFISNVDFTPFAQLLSQLDPATTLFIASSKSFRTPESLRNTQQAIRWLTQAAKGRDWQNQFIAITTNQAAAAELGIASDRMLPLWDWVGGRYSLWSAIGLPIAIARGFESYQSLLNGAQAMDKHFRQTPLEQNLPVCLALVGIWQRNFLETRSLCINSYWHSLSLLTLYLQQLEMESNGKSVRRDGHNATTLTGQVVWGDVGTNGQHAYFQFLHQGNDAVAIDFIAVLKANHAEFEQHQFLLANCLAQSEVLLRGTRPVADSPEAAAHRTLPGDRASNLIVLRQFDAFHLGALIALYEHKTFCQGVLWGINSFDQFGVEAGKTQAEAIMQRLVADATPEATQFDGSTEQLIAMIRAAKS